VAERPNTRGVPGGLDEWEAESSLAAELGAVVDDARALVAGLGLAPYRGWSVVLRWSGGAKGRGEATVVSRTEIVPSPVVDFGNLRRAPKDAGSPERGEARLRKISPRYTEAEVTKLFPRALGPGEEAFLEVVADGRFADGDPQARRRFVIAGAPYLDQMRFEWVVSIRAQDDRMAPNGNPRRPPEPWTPR